MAVIPQAPSGAGASVYLDANGKLPAIDGSNLTGIVGVSASESFDFGIGGYLDVPALPLSGLGAELVKNTGSINKLIARRGVAGSTGTTTIVLELNGSVQAAATLSWTFSDAAYALKTVTFTPFSIAVGDRLSLRLTSAETGAQDIRATAVTA